jgi:hypothetical protein
VAGDHSPVSSDREGWAVFIGTERPQFLVQDLAAVAHATRLVLADAERLRKRAAPETRAV